MAASRKIFYNKLASLPHTDHRYIGFKQKLFFFHDDSQGSCFFEPRGAHIYNRLINYLRQEYIKRNYQEVITPNIYSNQLWQTSGHWEHYEDNMIKLKVAEREFSLKPMNCPGHCLIYKHQGTLSKEMLPVRWADFGVLHRNELSGSLIGLSRVRRFQQDDAHIFCAPDQVESEVSDCLSFASQVYKNFGFNFDVNLSLRPESYIGKPELWDQAEQSLRSALEKNKLNWEEKEFQGAFYGPKIDLIMKDCRDRQQQCATIQLDFQLAERFGLIYNDSPNSAKSRPVIIHRAILGSIERFIAMVAESCKGRWPFWLSPLQAKVIPVHSELNNYAKSICEDFRRLGFWVDCDTSNSTLNAKVRDASILPYNVILIVGQREKDMRSVTIRALGNGDDSIHTKSVGKEQQATGKHAVKTVHNVTITIEKLMERFREFEERHVNRADIELLNTAFTHNKTTS